MTPISMQTAPPPAPLTSLIEDAVRFAKASRAASTTRQYASAWKAFEAFCATHGLSALPASIPTVSVYLSSLATGGKSISTVDVAYASIKYFHSQRRISLQWDDPALTEVMAGIRRTSVRKKVKAVAVLADDLKTLVGSTDSSLIGVRDRAILLLGFAGALRRSEIVALQMDDVAFVDEGAVITLRRSKTDQEGKGVQIGIPFASDASACPVLTLQAWMTAVGEQTGPLFRQVGRHQAIRPEGISTETVRLILQRASDRSGHAPQGRLSPHSLRAGFCTAAALKGSPLQQIAQHARHSSTQTTMGYIRVAELFREHAGAGLL